MVLTPYEHDGTPLSERLTAYYRHVVATHSDDPVIGACPICKVRRCEDWRSAGERLAYSDPRLAALADPDRLLESGHEAPGPTPIDVGDVVDVAEEDYRYGLGDLTLRITKVLGLLDMEDGPWVTVDGIPLWPGGQEGEERYAQLRVGAIRRHRASMAKGAARSQLKTGDAGSALDDIRLKELK